MIFFDFLKERKIKRILRKLSKQRVAFILQPGNVWVIEKAMEDNDETDIALKTCLLRGWVEPLEEVIPKGKLTAEGKLPDGNIFDKVGPLYKLTDIGWAVINWSHGWFLISVSIAFVLLIFTIILK